MLKKKSSSLMYVPLSVKVCRSCRSRSNQGCQMEYFQTKNRNLGKFWRVLQWKMWVYFMNIWSILWPLIYSMIIRYIFCGNLVHFFTFWYIVGTRKNLATLVRIPPHPCPSMYWWWVLIEMLSPKSKCLRVSVCWISPDRKLYFYNLNKIGIFSPRECSDNCRTIIGTNYTRKSEA
jgi:hypothetical protein